MPVTKNGNSKVAEQKECCGTHGSCCTDKKCYSGHCCSFGKKIILTLVGILLVYVIVFVGSLIRNNIQKFYFIGKADKMERTILVQGIGKVTVKPDIAQVTMGTTSDGKTVEEAQTKNTEVMNKMLGKLKALNIEEKDIQTSNYNIYPQYDYTEDKGQVLKGYQVSQNVTIKVRNLQNADKVVALAGEVGANNVGGLQFTFDDKEVYKDQARELALKQIAEKAKGLSKSLGVRLIAVVSYDEYEGGNVPYMPMKYDVMGMGGATEAAPSIQAGTNEVILNVNVGFEIR